jgi:phosphinothricin acetyltransferase
MLIERNILTKNKFEIRIRNATENDLFHINDIYNYYVVNSTATFQTSLESLDERIIWFREHNDMYPVIIAESDDKIAGWASISKFKKREAYKPTVENSIYINHDYLFQGIGTVLLREVINLAKFSGYHSIIAGISADQEVSVILHKNHGFAEVARLKEVGFKFNKWLDVVYYQLLL